MRTWPLQQARDHLREVVDGALQDGPQRITRHGRQAVVVVSEEEWARVVGKGVSFGELLARCPLEEGDLPPRRPARVTRSNLFE